MKVYIIFCTLFLAGCNIQDKKAPQGLSNGSEELSAGNFYEDIDITSLSGINPLHEITYPSIKITDSGSQKKAIVFYATKSDKFELDLEKKNNQWTGHWSVPGDTSWIFSFCYLKGRELITVSYSDTTTFKLVDVSVINDSGNFIYYPRHDFKRTFESHLKDAELIRKNYGNNYSLQIKYDNDIAVQKQTTISHNGERVSSQTKCCKQGRHSIIWWLYFGPWLKTEECSLDQKEHKN